MAMCNMGGGVGWVARYKLSTRTGTIWLALPGGLSCDQCDRPTCWERAGYTVHPPSGLCATREMDEGHDDDDVFVSAVVESRAWAALGRRGRRRQVAASEQQLGGHHRARQGRAGQGRAGKDRTGRDKARQGKATLHTHTAERSHSCSDEKGFSGASGWSTAYAASQPINLSQTGVSLNGRVTKTDNVHPPTTSTPVKKRAWDCVVQDAPRSGGRERKRESAPHEGVKGNVERIAEEMDWGEPLVYMCVRVCVPGNKKKKESTVVGKKERREEGRVSRARGSATKIQSKEKYARGMWKRWLEECGERREFMDEVCRAASGRKKALKANHRASSNVKPFPFVGGWVESAGLRFLPFGKGRGGGCGCECCPACCVLRFAVCGLRSAVCGLRSEVCNPPPSHFLSHASLFFFPCCRNSRDPLRWVRAPTSGPSNGAADGRLVHGLNWEGYGGQSRAVADLRLSRARRSLSLSL
ncbi:hypothetical protein B0J11DRAFT_508037 [Dendryphion nanum]|uniref:Uncharacterized protein n=1 Tax=Dendryphion nanum TaxID=256645 RepID=A0A9P9DKT6_9PLEO|nr:hypothetical protein B0J11DRAFT_508037 [Dendryphion nanum]